MTSQLLKTLTLCWIVLWSSASLVSGTEWLHGTASSGLPRLDVNFAHLPYVNPQAFKGGTLRLAALGAYDSFNDQVIKGEPAPGVELTYQTLMTPSLDEADISSEYGLLAEATKFPDDFSSVSFRLNPKAKWHDGVPVSVDDVIWSFTKLKALNPLYNFYFANVTKGEMSGTNEVTFTFDVKNNRELPRIMGQLPIFAKHWWEGKDASGKPRNIAEPTLEAPLGSGGYKIGKFSTGKFVEYERVPDAWANNHNTQIGTNNFDVIHYDLYGDEAVMMEAFKADAFDYRVERSSKNWATGYVGLNALTKGFVVKAEYPSKASGKMQAFVPNLRRTKFQDPRVRRALNLAFDFETTNRNAFFGIYQRANSYYSGTALASSGLPQGKELDILNEFKADLPAALFTSEYKNPVGGDNTKMRANYREALGLLKDAGWVVTGNVLKNVKSGEPFKIEVIDNSELFGRAVLPYAESLKKIGITMNFRVIDSSALVERKRKFDFDMVINSWGQSLSPGNEQRDQWGSEAADRIGSQNLTGIKNPVIDRLIDKVIFATDRDTLVAATHALDRTLLWNHYVVPQWFSMSDRYVYWDRFGKPDRLPEYSFGFPTVWWFDKEKAARITK